MYAEAPAFHLKTTRRSDVPPRTIKECTVGALSRRKRGKLVLALAKSQKQSTLRHAPQEEKNQQPRYTHFISGKKNKTTACLLGAQTLACWHLARPNGCQTSMSTSFPSTFCSSTPRVAGTQSAGSGGVRWGTSLRPVRAASLAYAQFLTLY